MRYVCPITQLGIKTIIERSQLTRPQENMMTEKSMKFRFTRWCWANSNDLSQDHHKWWFSMGIPPRWWRSRKAPHVQHKAIQENMMHAVATTWHLILDFFIQRKWQNTPFWVHGNANRWNLYHSAWQFLGDLLIEEIVHCFQVASASMVLTDLHLN